MDGNRFDDLTKFLANSHSRRSIFGGFVGGALALAGAGRASARSVRVKVCHQPGTPAQQTLIVDSTAVPDHLGHGDYTNASSCCAVGVAVCVDAAGKGTCCPAPSRCLGNGVCCTPTTCAAQGVTCGSISDTCGGTLDCGTCGDGQTCHQGSCCTPTCQGNACGGGLPDGCGGTINCTCPAEQVCHDGSCCTPTCPGNACGNDLPNGCGGTINCKCLAGDVCHDGECCTPTCQGNACGNDLPDGCGGEINCKCLAGDVCDDGECCTPVTSCPAGQTCGTAPNGCGGTIECGSCSADACQICSDDATTCVSTCNAPLTCLAGTCKLPDGASGCTDDSQCHSGTCAAGTCQATPGADGTACDSDADCLGGDCVNIVAGSGVCCTTGKACGTVCCASNTQVCDPAGDCCSPATCDDQGVTCGVEFDNCGHLMNCGTCPEGTFCQDGGCICIVDGALCDPAGADVCCSDCNEIIPGSGICGECRPVRASCEFDLQCCGTQPTDSFGNCKLGSGYCCSTAGGSCSQTTDCCTWDRDGFRTTCQAGRCCGPKDDPCINDADCCSQECTVSPGSVGLCQ